MKIREDTKYVLVIEEEGIFTRPVEERFLLKVPCIMTSYIMAQTLEDKKNVTTAVFLGLCANNLIELLKMKTIVKI